MSTTARLQTRSASWSPQLALANHDDPYVALSAAVAAREGSQYSQRLDIDSVLRREPLGETINDDDVPPYDAEAGDQMPPPSYTPRGADALPSYSHVMRQPSSPSQRQTPLKSYKVYQTSRKLLTFCAQRPASSNGRPSEDRLASFRVKTRSSHSLPFGKRGKADMTITRGISTDPCILDAYAPEHDSTARRASSATTMSDMNPHFAAAAVVGVAEAMVATASFDDAGPLPYMPRARIVVIPCVRLNPWVPAPAFGSTPMTSPPKTFPLEARNFADWTMPSPPEPPSPIRLQRSHSSGQAALNGQPSRESASQQDPSIEATNTADTLATNSTPNRRLLWQISHGPPCAILLTDEPSGAVLARLEFSGWGTLARDNMSLGHLDLFHSSLRVPDPSLDQPDDAEDQEAAEADLHAPLIIAGFALSIANFRRMGRNYQNMSSLSAAERQREISVGRGRVSRGAMRLGSLSAASGES